MGVGNMKRTKHEIRADILRIASMGAIKTQIVYGANLNFKIAEEHINALIASGRLRKTAKHYWTLERRYRYIASVEALK